MDAFYAAGRQHALEKLGFIPMMIANQVNKPAAQPTGQPAASAAPAPAAPAAPAPKGGTLGQIGRGLSSAVSAASSAYGNMQAGTSGLTNKEMNLRNKMFRSNI